jgi:2-methylcitrate dehydratase
MKTLVEEIADWVADLKYDVLPRAVISRAKLVLLDTLGCALGAVNATPVQLARQAVSEQGGNPQATLVGVSWKTSCDQAAFVNGIALRYLDLNDYTPAGGHPSINVAPALAVAEAQGRNGKDLIMAIIAGYEVQLRLREAARQGTQEGWDHSTRVHYSAAALAGKLFALPPSKIAHALAIAGSHACTLAEVRKGKLSMWKGAAEAMAAKTGTFAAILAKAGLTGPLTILEGSCGYATVVTGALDEELLRKGWEDFQILKSCLKMWPCVFVAQAPVAAVLQACAGRSFNAEQIDKIVIELSDFAYRQQMNLLAAGLATRESADHSVPYCVARAVLHGEVRLQHFEERALTDAMALAVLKKISLAPSSAFQEKVGAAVEILLCDGTKLRAQIYHPPGHTKNPASESEVIEKFRSLAAPVLGPQRAQRICDAVLHIEEATALQPLLAPLSLTGSAI